MYYKEPFLSSMFTLYVHRQTWIYLPFNLQLNNTNILLINKQPKYQFKFKDVGAIVMKCECIDMWISDLWISVHMVFKVDDVKIIISQWTKLILFF